MDDVGKTLPLKPINDAPHPTWNFHYTPKSAPDRFSVHVIPKKWGYSFAIQFAVDWYDPETMKNFATKSKAYAAFFPTSKDPLAGLRNKGKTWEFRQKQTERWARKLNVTFGALN